MAHFLKKASSQDKRFNFFYKSRPLCLVDSSVATISAFSTQCHHRALITSIYYFDISRYFIQTLSFFSCNSLSLHHSNLDFKYCFYFFLSFFHENFILKHLIVTRRCFDKVRFCVPSLAKIVSRPRSPTRATTTPRLTF